jgi:hypothetical protein
VSACRSRRACGRRGIGARGDEWETQGLVAVRAEEMEQRERPLAGRAFHRALGRFAHMRFPGRIVTWRYNEAVTYRRLAHRNDFSRWGEYGESCRKGMFVQVA